MILWRWGNGGGLNAADLDLGKRRLRAAPCAEVAAVHHSWPFVRALGNGDRWVVKCDLTRSEKSRILMPALVAVIRP